MTKMRKVTKTIDRGAPFHALRFQSHVPINRRKHDLTLGRFSTWSAAEEEMTRRDPSGDLLEVVTRFERIPLGKKAS